MAVILSCVLTLAFAGVSGAQVDRTNQNDDAEDTFPESIRAAVLNSLEWRNIGPSRGGRVQSVAGVVGNRFTYYMGATGGGVWKTTDAGGSWSNITDGFVNTGSVGALAVAESDPNVIYLGMGEADIRGNFSHGDGVYKSLDAGKTWTHIGLDDTRQIGRIRVHPRDEDIVYVAALGHVFAPNPERGVFRSTDGGDTWKKVLFVNNETGAIDITFDPSNPRTLYAAMWQVQRTPWSLESGGPGSGLYRSTDSGETWKKLTDGLPKGIKGKIGVTVSPVNPQRVWALVEAEDGGVYRSDNGGDTFRKLSDDAELRQRAWYYTHIYADPQEVNTVYVLNVGFHKSTDGGRTFTERIRVPHSDNHDLWIDPSDNQRMVNGNDGGANVSFNGGESWSRQDNQPTAQFYRVTTDTRHPYHVYGAQQDNSTVSIAHTARPGSSDFYDVGGGESGYIAVRPDNPNIVFAGSYGGYLTRYDHNTGVRRNIMIWPENPMGAGVEAMDYRFQWTFPIVLSPHDPDVLYVGSQHVHRSTDDGHSWEVISPDLTVADPQTMQSSGGPITKDNTGVEYYATVFTIAESPLERGLIWAGSDDGLIHVTSDNGETWQNVTPRDLGDWPMISLIEASPHDANTAYAAVNRYKMDDFMPYIYKTTDRGQSWTLIAGGIADDAFVRSVREDPARKGILYAGTELGVWCSWNGGESWSPLQGKLPIVPVTDVAVKDNDLVIATQGRSFWILEQLDAIRALEVEPEITAAYLLPLRGSVRGQGQAEISYWIPQSYAGPVDIELLDSAGGVIHTFHGDVKAADDGNDAAAADADATTPDSEERAGEIEVDASAEVDHEEAVANEMEEEEKDESEEATKSDRKAPAEHGLNRLRWDGRYPDAVEVKGAVMWAGSTRGPVAPPGEYSVRLRIAGDTLEQPLVIRPDPRTETTAAEYAEQFELALRVRDALSDAHRTVNALRSIRNAIDATVARAKEMEDTQPILDAATSLKRRLKDVEEALIQTRSKSSQDPLNYPIRLNNKIAALMGAMSDSYPLTPATRAVFNKLHGQLDEYLKEYSHIVEEDIPAFNQLVREHDIPAVVAPVDAGDDER
ncbi:MAG: WD40/YVTN/BNR-like repeat-containing protein [Phycisphaerales bacterium]